MWERSVLHPQAVNVPKALNDSWGKAAPVYWLRPEGLNKKISVRLQLQSAGMLAINLEWTCTSLGTGGRKKNLIFITEMSFHRQSFEIVV